MTTRAGIFKFCFVSVCALLLGAAVQPRPALAIHSGKGCLFTLNIPTMALYPFVLRLRGDDDIDGAPATITFDTLIEQPPWKQGEKPKPFQFTIKIHIAEIGGDGSAYTRAKTIPVLDRWVKGGSVKQIYQCLNDIFKTCVGIFAKEAKTEAQLMAQCANASDWRLKHRFNGKSSANNRSWTTYKPKTKGLIASASCLSDANGRDSGAIGCKAITFRKNIGLDINFGHKPLAR